MDNKKYLYGASGHCKVIIDILQSNNEAVEAVFDDNPATDFTLGVPIISVKADIDFSEKKMLISIGNNNIRKRIAEGLGTAFYSVVHPKAIVSKYTTIEVGSVIMAGAILNVEAHIGKHCIINTGAVVEHDCLLADFVHLSPNVSLAGNVSVGEGSHIENVLCNEKKFNQMKANTWDLLQKEYLVDRSYNLIKEKINV
jgi:acetyltransferase EpsM